MILYRIANGYFGDRGDLHVIVIAEDEPRAVALAAASFKDKADRFNAAIGPNRRYVEDYWTPNPTWRVSGLCDLAALGEREWTSEPLD